MAAIDPRHDTVVIRIVYDGPPFAGKTTSVRALARGVGGEVVAPREIDGRTLYFDWLDYTGGLFEGRRIRCQIVSVPGQATLAPRRRRLLETADAVVFVGDCAPTELGAMSSYLEGLRSVLDRVDGPPIGIVLQANKRDHPHAVPLDAVRAALDRIGGRVAIVESVAIGGVGIREAFVFAVRLALDRVRELMRAGDLRTHAPAVDNPADLLAQLQNADGAALELAAASRLKHTRLCEVGAQSVAVSALREVVGDGRDGAAIAEPAAPAAVSPRPARAADSALAAPTAPDGQVPWVPTADLPSGMIWPPVSGRLLLHHAMADAVTLRRHPREDWFGVAATGWRLHSPATARFERLDQGRDALVNWARMHAASAHVLSSERCVVLCADGAGQFRLWQIVRVEASLRDELDAALRDGPAAVARGLLALTRAFLLAAERFGTAGCWLPLTLRSVGATSGSSRYLGQMPDPQHARPAEARPNAATLRLLALQLQYALPDLHAQRGATLERLDALIAHDSGAPQDPTHGFVRGLLDPVAA